MEGLQEMLHEAAIQSLKDIGVDPSQPVTGYVLAGAISGVASAQHDLLQEVIRRDIEEKGPIFQTVKNALEAE